MADSQHLEFSPCGGYSQVINMMTLRSLSAGAAAAGFAKWGSLQRAGAVPPVMCGEAGQLVWMGDDHVATARTLDARSV